MLRPFLGWRWERAANGVTQSAEVLCGEEPLFGSEQRTPMRIIESHPFPDADARVPGNDVEVYLRIDVHEEGVVVGVRSEGGIERRRELTQVRQQSRPLFGLKLRH